MENRKHTHSICKNEKINAVLTPSLSVGVKRFIKKLQLLHGDRLLDDSDICFSLISKTFNIKKTFFSKNIRTKNGFDLPRNINRDTRYLFFACFDNPTFCFYHLRDVARKEGVSRFEIYILIPEYTSTFNANDKQISLNTLCINIPIKIKKEVWYYGY